VIDRISRRALVLAAAFALLAFPVLRAGDDWERRVSIHADTLIRGVSVPAFRGLDGKTQPAGLYDLNLSKGTQGILIGLLRNGKKVGEFPGKFVPPASRAGMADGSVKPGAKVSDDWEARARLNGIHFDGSSKVGFEYGGIGRISCSNNLHPGGNEGSISFLLPAVQLQGK
jgi:hypothetical protein